MIKPIKVLPARERVVAELRKAILTGAFEVGMELAQDKIAEMMGLSRMPVREAIQILASEGLVELRPNRSAVVRNFSQNYIKEHFDIRILLECEAAARASVRIRNLGDIEAIHEQHQLAIKQNDMEQLQATNQAFHLILWDAAENTKLKIYLEQLWNGLTMELPLEEADRMHREHESIMQALRERDPEKVRFYMKKHLEHSMQRMINVSDLNMEKNVKGDHAHATITKE